MSTKIKNHRSFGKPYFIGSVLITLFFASSLRAQAWHSIAPMHFQRTELCAVAFPDGRVLVAGGNDGSEVLSSCEVYNPKTNTWTLTGSMNEARYRFPMITLSDGRIMVAGGLTDMATSTTDGVEIYDTQTGVWTQMAPMSTPRENLPLYLLPDSTVFICGGANANTGTYLSSTEIYDPSTNTYQELSDMQTGVFGPFIFFDTIHKQILLQGGSYNGLPGTYPPLLQIYDFASDTWSYGPNTATSHDGGFNVEMPDQSIVVVGGRTGSYTCTDSVEILPPPYTTWQYIGQLTSMRWHGSPVIVGIDSILAIGGDNDPGINTDIFDSTNWFLVNEKQTLQGPIMLAARSNFVAVLSKQPIAPCVDSEVIYAFGGASTTQVLNSCEALPLGIKGLHGSGPPTLALPSTPQSITEAGCGAVDTSVLLGVAGCGITSGTLDSIWLSGSMAFRISDVRSAPRTLAALDSITISYLGASSSDTAQLHIRYDLGSGALDTVVTVIGSLTSPLLAAPEQIHREAASAYFGQIDTLTLAVDVNAAINLDSLWPYLTDLSGRYTWDSSVASYAGYLAPSGWSVSSLATSEVAVDFGIHKLNGSATQPLNLGTGLFQPTGQNLATSWVELPNLVMNVSGKNISLCVTDNEDNHWAVKTLGVLSGVAGEGTGGTSALQEFVIYPNPAEDELFVRNAGEQSAAITLYDAIGRIVGTGNADAESTATLDTHSLASGVYFARIVSGGVGSSKVFVKE
jgi:N-acetylneuraminic acid mutarotase